MGGKSGSKTTTDKSTNISTRTTTNIGSVGITGANLVELAAVIQEGAAFQTREVVNAVELQARNIPRGTATPALAGTAASGGGLSPTLLLAGGIAAAALITFASR